MWVIFNIYDFIKNWLPQLKCLYRFQLSVICPANIRLDEDVFRLRLQKTSWRRLQKHLDQDEYIHLTHTSSEDVFKTSSRHLDQDQHNRLGHTSSRHLQDVLKTSSRRLAKTFSRHLQDVFKTFSRRLQDIFKTYSRRFEDVFKTSCKDLFKTFSRRIIKLNCSC